VAEESWKLRCSSAAFPKLFNAVFSCYNVMLLPENQCSTSLFTTGYKRFTEERQEAFGWGRILNGVGVD
jgi:hypothetical protein